MMSLSRIFLRGFFFCGRFKKSLPVLGESEMDWTFVLLKRFSLYLAFVLYVIFLVSFPEGEVSWLAFLIAMIGATLFQTLVDLIVYQPLPVEGGLQEGDLSFAERLSLQSPIHKAVGVFYFKHLGDLGKGIGFFLSGNFLAILVGFAVIRSSFAWSGGILWPVIVQCIVFACHYSSPLRKVIDRGYDVYTQTFPLDRETEAEVVAVRDAFIGSLGFYVLLLIIFAVWRVIF